MRIGVIRTSRKENERRASIYPDHLPRFSKILRKKMIFEKGYGDDFGYSDDYFLAHGATIASREGLIKNCELVILPKPMPKDIASMSCGHILFGWPHSVQQVPIAQLAIDHRITVIAWESMHLWSATGEKIMHVFYRNNELAGYAAVLHSLQLMGIDGYYGPRRKVVIFGHGSVSRGAIYALHGRGFNNIHVFTRRKTHHVGDQNPDVYYGHFFRSKSGELVAIDSEGRESLLIDEIANADIICNGILQDVNDPIMFVKNDEIGKLKPKSMIIDISCDKGMGFPFAKPTTFNEPVFTVGDRITYYSVDHTPSYLWNAASREISKALLPYLEVVAKGERAWVNNATIHKAIDFRNGVIVNNNILNYQKRRLEYPHHFA